MRLFKNSTLFKECYCGNYMDESFNFVNSLLICQLVCRGHYVSAARSPRNTDVLIGITATKSCLIIS